MQVERRTGKVRRPKTDVLPLYHATKLDDGVCRALFHHVCCWCSMLATVAGHGLVSYCCSLAQLPNSYSSKHITRVLCGLCCLWITEQIQLCLCVLRYCCLNGTVSSYLVESIHWTADVEALSSSLYDRQHSLYCPCSEQHQVTTVHISSFWCMNVDLSGCIQWDCTFTITFWWQLIIQIQFIHCFNLAVCFSCLNILCLMFCTLTV